MTALEFPGAMDYTVLQKITPTEWKNTGPTLSHALTMMLNNQINVGINICHIKALLEKFVKKTMTFMKTNEQEQL